MLRRLTSLGVVTLGFSCLLLAPLDAAAQGATAPVPTGKKLVTTPMPAVPTPAAVNPAPTSPAGPPPAPAPSSSPAPAPSSSPALAPSSSPALAPSSSPAPSTVERARQGVVVLERQGKALSLGIVLEGDGRILTALSPLSHGNFLSARYHDGAVVPLKLVLGDRGWDLALLAPVSSPAQPLRKLGLRAARTPSFIGLQTFGLAPPNKVNATPATLGLSAGLLGGDATPLGGALELGAKPALVGGPVVSQEGEVVALVARACPANGAANCVPAPYGAPVSALKQFLQRVPAEATWLGVEVAGDEVRGVRGVRVAAIVPSGPAAVAGVRPGMDGASADLIVAVDGTPVATPAELNEAVRARTAGDSIELLLFGLGRYRHVTVKPRPAPQLTVPPIFAPKPGSPRTPNPYR